MATLTVSGQVLLHAHPINMHNFLLSRVFQSDRFKAKFSDFFGDQIAFQAGYFETDHDGYYESNYVRKLKVFRRSVSLSNCVILKGMSHAGVIFLFCADQTP